MPHPFVFILAQAAQPNPNQVRLQDLQGQIFQWAVIFLGILFFLWIVVAMARRRAARQVSGSMMPFTLSDLRQMRDTGQLSEDEFEIAKDKMVVLARQAYADDDETAEKESAPESLNTPPEMKPTSEVEAGESSGSDGALGPELLGESDAPDNPPGHEGDGGSDSEPLDPK